MNPDRRRHQTLGFRLQHCYQILQTAAVVADTGHCGTYFGAGDAAEIVVGVVRKRGLPTRLVCPEINESTKTESFNIHGT
ncbi:hypothetical protein BCR33DRAFT_729312 [Rhizoclosmatium globosum]|uniref:Uncharacterized protein n=1 Tax=Rhizoclosmatium globosum TaxID=329046 RepID=A0A1Y2AH08_9FUNG|nr:hypothetical protein BCR33DRAFT_729312 [Rhizoclosmatium globosum]|eukprot:ORY21570.1 hypothetical protein BCR33DRAFT_729312 [Rhizoclosmatium globosum]